MAHEEWRAVADYDGVYEVSSAGRVRSSDGEFPWYGTMRKRKGRVLRTPTLGSGYPHVNLCLNGVQTRHLVHRLVARAFLGEPAAGRDQVNHKNSVRTDNRVENLEWVSHLENMRHSARDGRLRVPQPNRSGLVNPKVRKKSTPESVERIRELCAERRFTQREIGAMFGVSKGFVSAVVNNRLWRDNAK